MNIKDKHYLEYGKVKYKGKMLTLGVANIDGVEYNKGYYVEEVLGKIKLIPLKSDVEDDRRIRAIFKLDTPSIDFDEEKMDLISDIASEKFKFKDINIEDYMPSKYSENIDESSYDLILKSLKKIQDKFGYASAENLMNRLPELTVGHLKNGLHSNTMAFYRTKANFLGICEKGNNKNLDQVLIHELNHLSSSACEFDEDANLICTTKNGFIDKNFNGIAVTEGFTELLASLITRKLPISYYREFKWAGSLLSFEEDKKSVIDDYYRANTYRTRSISDDERKAKKFTKCMDYNFALHYYNVSHFADVYEYTKRKFIEILAEEKGVNVEDFTPQDHELIDSMVKEVMSEQYEVPFTQSTFMPTLENILLEKYESVINSDVSDNTKELSTLSIMNSMVFSFDASDETLIEVDPKKLEEVDINFIRILYNRGLSMEDIEAVLEGRIKRAEGEEDANYAPLADENKIIEEEDEI